MFLFFLFLFRAVLRREWVAGVAMVLFLPTLIFALTGSPFVLVMTMILNGATVFLITRLGLLAMVVSVAYQTCFLQSFPLTTNTSAWYAGLSLLGILLMAAIAFYGFYTSLGGRPMFGSAGFEE